MTGDQDQQHEDLKLDFEEDQQKDQFGEDSFI